jgi:hypothetical protein
MEGPYQLSSNSSKLNPGPSRASGSIWRNVTAITPRPHDWLYIATIMSSRGFGPRFVLSAGL